MDSYEPRRRQRSNRVRERQESRQRRREMAVPHGASTEQNEQPSAPYLSIFQRVILWLRDAVWYLTHKPLSLRWPALFVGVIAILFIFSHLISGRIFPNVWALGVYLGDKTVEEAETALRSAWENEIRIALIVEGQTLGEVKPSELGLDIDAKATADAARGIGMSGIPFGYNLNPPVTFRYATGETYLLNITDQINKLPYNAGYQISNGQLLGINGRDGRYLDIPVTLEQLQADPLDIVNRQRLIVITQPIPPDVTDPTPYLEQVRQFASKPFQLTGYDPFTDTTTSWGTTPENFVTWLEAGEDGLVVRESAFKMFIDALNETVSQQDETRYIAFEDAYTQVQQAVETGQNNAYLRMRHYPQTYEVQAGDRAYSIARKTGIPYFLIEEMNTGRNLNELYPGDVINLPSRDVTIPEIPIPTKRIVVNLDDQSLVAFENGQPVFEWLISSGVDTAPTSPGVYQILDHQEIAYGSSYTLCGDNGCGQWKMYWFMSIYEVSPGLMNGFHGAVELPNGAYLGGGSVGAPYTFGCVMSENGNAETLYEWAEQGTIVEIISSEYAPQSELARKVLSNEI